MEYDEAVSFLAKKLVKKPSVFIIYTNALGKFPDILEKPMTVPCDEVPHFPAKRDGCFSPKFIFGKLLHKYILVLQGRYHFYEGFSSEEISFPVKIAFFLGCSRMLVTNSSGSISKGLELGDIMFIRDHVNLTGENVLEAYNEIRRKTKETSEIYDENFMSIARKLSIEEGMDKYFTTGIYAMVGNAVLENSAKILALKKLGADAVGTSTIPEVLTAAELKMGVFGMSVITDKGILDYEHHPDPLPEEVSRAIEPKKGVIRKIILKYIEYCRNTIHTGKDSV